MRELAIFILFALVRSEECPELLQDKCTCKKESENGRNEVRCNGLNAREILELSQIKNLHVLVVHNSNFEGLTSKVEFFDKNLTKLRLENNEIHDLNLKEFLCAYPNLEEVTFNDNSVLWLTIDPKCNKNLHRLGLRQNHIHFLLNETLQALEKMDDLVLDLSDNTFSCDCNLIPTLRWIQNKMKGGKGAELVSPELYTCRDGFPEELTGRNLIDLDPDLMKCDDQGVENKQIFVDDYSKHSSYIIFYAMLGFVISVAVIIGAFALVLNFPNLVQSVRGWQKKRKVVSNKNYTTLRETQA